MSLEERIENWPIIGPLVLLLTDQGFWTVFAAVPFSWWIINETDFALMGYLITVGAFALAGIRRWRDARVAIENNRGAILDITGEVLESIRFEIPFRGSFVTVDIPDSLEPILAEEMLNAVLGILPNDEA